MAKSPSRRPPPLPAQDESDIDSTRIILVLAGIVVFIAILTIALLSTGRDIADSNGNGGSAAETSAGNGNGENNTEDGTGDEESESSAGTGSAEKSEANTSGEEANQGLSTAEDEVATDSRRNQASGDETDAEDQALPPGAESPSPKSNSKVRNTFNPFGSTSPPKRPEIKPTPTEPGKSADFFGVAAEGKSFVYVVDKSSSMAFGKFDAARQELIKSIDSLRPNQEFFVIFFDSSFHPQPTKGLVRATPRNKKVVKDWMMNAIPYAATEPYPAIEYAIELHPDGVYVLSDGEFDPSVVSQVTAINRDFTIPIHTIAFTTNAQTLKELANRNRGNYRFVP